MWAGLFFVLGFMTKFVAALFLPFTLGPGGARVPRVRRRLVEDWRAWLGVAAVVFLLCAPWFIYAQVRFGSQLWETILGEHVLQADDRRSSIRRTCIPGTGTSSRCGRSSSTSGCSG